MSELSTKSDEDLLKERNQIEAELKKRAAKERQSAVRQILDIAAKHEIDLLTLAKKPSPRVMRYRDPENQFNKWNGKGRQPGWVKEQLAKGKTLADLEIK